MQKAITIKDLAKELNISPTTVSKALKDYPDISDKTKKRVRDLAQKWNYSPNLLAQSLRNSTSHIIGLVIPEIVHHFFSQVISGITEYAQKRGYMVIVLQSNETSELEKKQIELLNNFKVDGVLISLANDSTNLDHLYKLKDRGIPIVMFDKTEPDFPCSKVSIDDYHSAFLATEHLIEEGYQKIAHLGGPLLPRTAKNRVKGYRDALIKNGRNFDENLVYRTEIGTLEEGYKSMNSILQNNKNVDAIFCICDMIAMGAMEAIKQNGLRIPEDIGVMGFSNSLLTSISRPKLSTVNQPGEFMGKVAVKQLIHEIENKDLFKQYEKIIIPTELIIRETTPKN